MAIVAGIPPALPAWLRAKAMSKPSAKCHTQLAAPALRRARRKDTYADYLVAGFELVFAGTYTGIESSHRLSVS